MKGPLRRMVAGAAAGAVGTLAMDLLWYRRYRSAGGEESFRDWELAAGTESFDDAGAPANFARRAASAVGVEIPDRHAGEATLAVHWLTGLGYAAVVLGMIDRRRNVAASGLATGAGAFLNSYAVLGAMGLYEPMWEYDADTLAEDLSAHLLFGATSAVVYRALTAGGRGRRH
jgi:hypothetical protein